LTCCGASVNGWALACGLAAENPTPAETDFPYKFLIFRKRVEKRIDIESESKIFRKKQNYN